MDVHLHQVRSAALDRDARFARKLQEYDRLVRMHLKVSSDELSREQFQEAIGVEYRIANPNYIAGPEWVGRSLESDGKTLERFIKQWRQHFVTTVQSKLLPHGWSVGAPVTINVQETTPIDRLRNHSAN